MTKSSNKKDAAKKNVAQKNVAKSTAIKQAVVMLLAILLLGGASWLATRALSPSSQTIAPPAAKSFYYDTETGALFVASATRDLPIAVPGAPEGAKPTGVIASVFSCSSCADEKSRQPYALETKDPNNPKNTVIAAIRKPKTPVSELTWISSTSPVAAEIEDEGLKGRCPGNAKPIFCQP